MKRKEKIDQNQIDLLVDDIITRAVIIKYGKEEFDKAPFNDEQIDQSFDFLSVRLYELFDQYNKL